MRRQSRSITDKLTVSVIKDTVLFLQINSKTELFMLCKRKKERRGGVPCKIYVEKTGFVSDVRWLSFCLHVHAASYVLNAPAQPAEPVSPPSV